MMAGPYGRVYASEIMEHCGQRLKRLRDSTDPRAVLADATRRAKRPGQATAVVASLFDRVISYPNAQISALEFSSSRPLIRMK